MIRVDFLQSYNKRVQKQKEKQSFSFLVMPSAVISYPKLQQTRAETKRKTKFFIFGDAECSRNQWIIICKRLKTIFPLPETAPRKQLPFSRVQVDRLAR